MAAGRQRGGGTRVAVAQVALEYPAMAGAAVLLPGLVNGYNVIVGELGAISRRLAALVAKLDRLCGTPTGRPGPARAGIGGGTVGTGPAAPSYTEE